MRKVVKTKLLENFAHVTDPVVLRRRNDLVRDEQQVQCQSDISNPQAGSATEV